MEFQSSKHGVLDQRITNVSAGRNLRFRPISHFTDEEIETQEKKGLA